MNEIKLNLPPIDTLNQEQLLEECNRWRLSAPRVLHELNLLMRFKHFAQTPEELNQKIEEMKLNYQGSIELKDRHIGELEEMIQYLKNDPLGIDRKFKKPIKIKMH